MATTTINHRTTPDAATGPAPRGGRKHSPYPYWFYAPAAVIYGVLFIAPTLLAFYFSLTRWTIFESEFIGFENYVTFFKEPALVSSLWHTLVYAAVTSGAKVVLGMLLAVLLTSHIVARGYLRSVVFFPVLVSAVAVGITFSVLLAPDTGLVDKALGVVGISGPDWLGQANTALISVALVDVWKGVGLATVIYIAGILSIPTQYYEAVSADGGGSWAKFWHVTLPLARPATFTVIASVIYKQYQAGFFGLSTAGNVVLFVLVTLIVFPLYRFFNSREVDL
jgi:raffinose/stachyose/melibiose transport system permease protein